MIVEFSNEVVNSVFVIGLSLCIETTIITSSKCSRNDLVTERSS